MKLQLLLLALPISLAACTKSDPPGATTTSAAASTPAPTASNTPTPSAVAVGPMKVLTKEQLPANVTIEGTLDKAIGWTDKNGDNVAVFSVRESSNKAGAVTVHNKYLQVDHIVTNPPRTLRTVKDSVEKCNGNAVGEFRPAALEVTDLDKDGVGELTFAYAVDCVLDKPDQAVVKLLTLENGDKYVLRGLHRGEADDLGKSTAAFTTDASFRKGPAPFLAHAKETWPKIRPEVAGDAPAKAKTAAAANKACTPLKWSSEEFPTTQVKDLTGKVWGAAGSDMTGKMEKFLAVALDTPLCSADGESVDEIQFFQLGGTEADFTKLWNSKDLRVTVSGEAATAETVHDHRPIVVRGTIKRP